MDRAQLADLVRSRLRDVPDFPAPGVAFKDFTPLLADPVAMRAVIDDVRDRFDGAVDLVAGIEARGFIVGASAAMGLGVGFVPIRKAGKLPGPSLSRSYDLEYGSATIEMHEGVVQAGSRVLVMDDVLATGGTAEAACALVEAAGGTVVAVHCILQIAALGGRERLAGRDVETILTG